MANSAIEILRNLYDLMIEINYHQSDADVLNALKENPDSFVEERLLKVKQYMAKHQALAYQQQMEQAIRKLANLKNGGVDEIRSLLPPDERMEYAKLFSKLERNDGNDKTGILEDPLLLKLLIRLASDNPNQ